MGNKQGVIHNDEDMPINDKDTMGDFIYPALLGKPNSDYYSSHFSEFRKSRKFKPTWNWPAFFLGSLWFAYREMYAYAFLNAIFFWLFASILNDTPFYVGLLNLPSPMSLAFVLSRDVLIWIGGAVYIILNYFVVPASANYLYYLHARRNAYQATIALSDLPPEESDSRVIVRIVSYYFVYLVISVFIVFVLAPIDIRRQAHIMERESEPLLHALTTYQSENEKYPVQLNQLIPDYLQELPLCRSNNKPPMYFLKEDGSSFMLTCYTFIFLKHTYTSNTNQWKSWD